MNEIQIFTPPQKKKKKKKVSLTYVSKIIQSTKHANKIRKLDLIMFENDGTHTNLCSVINQLSKNGFVLYNEKLCTENSRHSSGKHIRAIYTPLNPTFI